MGSPEQIQNLQAMPGYATSPAGRNYAALGGSLSPTIPASNTPVAPIPPAPIAPTAPTGTGFLPSQSQDDLYQQSLNSIFNPQPAGGFQLDASQFPFIPGGGFNISTPNVSPGSINAGQFTSNLGQGTATANLPPDILSQGQTQQAIQGLLNPQSIFDIMSGGPIVDEINARTNTLQDAFRTQQMANMDQGIAKIRAQLAAEGVLSGSDIINEQFDFTQGVLNDIAVFDAGLGLENTRYLGDLAMQDLTQRSNNLQRILVEANLQRGMNVNVAIADADRKSREIIAQAEISARVAVANMEAQMQASIANAQLGQQGSIAQAQLGTQMDIANLDTARALQLAQYDTQARLALGGQAAGVDVLALMQQDYQNQLANQMGVQQLPLNLLGGLAGPMSLQNMSGKSL